MLLRLACLSILMCILYHRIIKKKRIAAARAGPAPIKKRAAASRPSPLIIALFRPGSDSPGHAAPFAQNIPQRWITSPSPVGKKPGPLPGPGAGTEKIVFRISRANAGRVVLNSSTETFFGAPAGVLWKRPALRPALGVGVLALLPVRGPAPDPVRRARCLLKSQRG